MYKLYFLCFIRFSTARCYQLTFYLSISLKWKVCKEKCFKNNNEKAIRKGKNYTETTRIKSGKHTRFLSRFYLSRSLTTFCLTHTLNTQRERTSFREHVCVLCLFLYPFRQTSMYPAAFSQRNSFYFIWYGSWLDWYVI